MKKLYEVQATVVAYILADDEKEARREGRNAIHNEAMNVMSPEIAAQEITDAKHVFAKGWGRGSLVYGATRDTTLGEVYKSLPGVPTNASTRSPKGSKEVAEGDRKDLPAMPASSAGVKGGS